ncbi:unannotated protein [freshwater metagenome]|uniref:Thiamine pyrimidine synthase n=1 Tax=freshwater metagenome TaxID=449393 RepID=A0A6J7J5K9_9ZZZZ
MTSSVSLRVQLQWGMSAQFAGHISALVEGYYRDEGLEVELIPGGVGVDVVGAGSAPDGPEFTISWVPKVLAAVESGDSDLVSIAQIFQRSGTCAISLRRSGVTSVADFRGKRIGLWPFGNEFEMTAGAAKYGLVADVDYTRVTQRFDMAQLLSGEVDVAEAITYDSYSQILELRNPLAGRRYLPSDLHVIDWNVEGTAMLQDAIFARRDWLGAPGNEDIAIAFLRATFRGWIFAREHPDLSIDHVMSMPGVSRKFTAVRGPTQGRGHQTYQLNEVNPLIWPCPAGIGITEAASWDQTVQIALESGVLTSAPESGSFRNDLAERALAEIEADTTGASFVKGTAEITVDGC